MTGYTAASLDKQRELNMFMEQICSFLGNFGILKRLRNCKFCVYEFLNVFEFVNGNIYENVNVSL